MKRTNMKFNNVKKSQGSTTVGTKILSGYWQIGQ